MLIFMTGMMGAGKSTVGQSLANLLNMTFVDLDEDISNHACMNIPDIFSQYGESHFRNLEFEALERMCLAKNSIISLGGGALCSQKSWDIVPEQGHVVWLRASMETLMNRLKEDTMRPLLGQNTQETLISLLEQRSAWYSKAQYHVETDEKSPGQISQEIASRINGGAP